MSCKKLGVVICNYNKRNMVIDCISHILESNYRDFDLYVVDNASTDDSVEKIKSKFNNRLVLIESPENLGGSGGFNLGLRQAYKNSYDYLMCVDNDAMLDRDAIGNLVDFLDKDPHCGMAASKIFHLEKPDIIQNYGQIIDYDTFATRACYWGECDNNELPDVIYPDAVPACSLMIRTDIIAKIGFLPEENFLYWDDTQWCKNCTDAGFKVAAVGASHAYHSMGARKEGENTFPTYYSWRNWIKFFIKNTPSSRREDMVFTFLNNIFYAQYEAYIKQEYNKAATIMHAFTDAVKGIVGKAGDGIIKDTDTNVSYHDNVTKIKESEDLLVYMCHSVFNEDTNQMVQSLYNTLSANDIKNAYICDEADICIALTEYESFIEKTSCAKEVFIFSQLPLFINVLN